MGTGDGVHSFKLGISMKLVTDHWSTELYTNRTISLRLIPIRVAWKSWTRNIETLLPISSSEVNGLKLPSPKRLIAMEYFSAIAHTEKTCVTHCFTSHWNVPSAYKSDWSYGLDRNIIAPRGEFSLSVVRKVTLLTVSRWRLDLRCSINGLAALNSPSTTAE